MTTKSLKNTVFTINGWQQRADSINPYIDKKYQVTNLDYLLCNSSEEFLEEIKEKSCDVLIGWRVNLYIS